jgi:hypothetical protein
LAAAPQPIPFSDILQIINMHHGNQLNGIVATR